ncbi:MAG TPA: hypothetical protein VN680_09905, partial [Burkholderiaceae bacterium]|nr:hypothetical protein [Burkholderiaceae bacterium]
PETLARVTAQALTVAGHPATAQAVLDQYQSTATIEEAREDFRKARRWGINSFPALLMEVGDELYSVAPGYRSAAELLSSIDALQARVAQASAAH